MNINKMEKVTEIQADIGKYLVIKGEHFNEINIGKPVMILFDNSGDIPEVEEKELN